MKPERWRQIDELYHLALQRDAGQRTAFLRQVCNGDEEMQREVESLLAHAEAAEQFMQEPGMAVLAQAVAQDRAGSMIGRELGAYQILSFLGAGGMGEVYQARDTRLGRLVALKILPTGMATDPERKRRFLQEAKAASALNHPHIVAIYDIAETDGVQSIVMEYVPGKTLDQLIGRRGLRLNDILKYAVQIADALASAHAAGIIHRDLKPGNIMVTEQGVVKVLDFGLAKLTEAAPSEEHEATRTMKPATEEGTIIGTVAYMSPEQAEGKKVDARSDAFAFGSVLYEMVTGRRAFPGDSKLSTLSAILKDDPPPAGSIVAGVPRDLERIIKRCLRKDPDRRFQNMADLKVALAEFKEESDSGKLAAAVVQQPARRRHFVWPLGLAVAVVAVAGAAFWYMNTSRREAILTPVPLTTYPGFEGNASFSPDGIQVAFSWCKEERTPTYHTESPNICNIYIKQIGVEPPSRLTDTMAKDFSPSWSPDGKWIAFLRLVSATKLALLLVPQRSGRERVVREYDLTGFADMPPGPHVAWTPDSRWIVSTTPGREEWFLSLVALDSAETRILTKPSEVGLGDTAPSISPDGRMLVFSRYRGKRDLYKLRLSEEYAPQGEPQKLPSEEQPNLGASWLPDGSGIVFASKWDGENGLWRTSASSGGRPQRLPFAPTFATEPAVSRRGNRLAYTVYRNDSNIWRVQLAGPGRKPSAPERVISSTRREGGPACSPDGKRLAFVSDQSGTREVWLCDLDGSNPHQLTSLSGTSIDLPQWSPDGQNIALTIFEEGKLVKLGVISANSGALRRLPGEGKWPSWSPDGQWLYFASNRAPKPIWKMRPYGGAPVQITRGSGSDDMPQASPDGKFIYYNRGWPGPLSIWRTPVEGGEETKIIEGVSTGGQWTVGADGIYFFTTPDAKGRSEIHLYAFATGRATKILTVERSVGGRIAVSPDSRSIFYPQYDDQGSDLMLVENFR